MRIEIIGDFVSVVDLSMQCDLIVLGTPRMDSGSRRIGTEIDFEGGALMEIFHSKFHNKSCQKTTELVGWRKKL